MVIVGWVVWSAHLLLLLGMASRTYPDKGMAFLTRTRNVIMALFLVASAFAPISIFWVLLSFPVAQFVPMLLMSFQHGKMEDDIQRLTAEAEAQGMTFPEYLRKLREEQESTNG